MSARLAAFFDLDGTLLPLPSLERQLFRMLRYRREIPMKNYFVWLREALKLLPRGIRCVMHANKMYLRGVHSFDQRGVENRTDSYEHENRHSWRRRASQGEGQVSLPPN